jgi:hypothetical protein
MVKDEAESHDFVCRDGIKLAENIKHAEFFIYGQ